MHISNFRPVKRVRDVVRIFARVRAGGAQRARDGRRRPRPRRRRGRGAPARRRGRRALPRQARRRWRRCSPAPTSSCCPPQSESFGLERARGAGVRRAGRRLPRRRPARGGARRRDRVPVRRRRRRRRWRPPRSPCSRPRALARDERARARPMRARASRSTRSSRSTRRFYARAIEGALAHRVTRPPDDSASTRAILRAPAGRRPRRTLARMSLSPRARPRHRRGDHGVPAGLLDGAPRSSRAGAATARDSSSSRASRSSSSSAPSCRSSSCTGRKFSNWDVLKKLAVAVHPHRRHRPHGVQGGEGLPPRQRAPSCSCRCSSAASRSSCSSASRTAPARPRSTSPRSPTGRRS